MNSLDNLNINNQEKAAIMEASRVLREKFHAKEVILFGSKARGDDDIESDIDLLINNELYHIQLKYDVIISTLITTVSKWTDGAFSVLPIHDEISAQGIIA
jgi:predicted nucleotidyltransferase